MEIEGGRSMVPEEWVSSFRMCTHLHGVRHAESKSASSGIRADVAGTPETPPIITPTGALELSDENDAIVQIWVSLLCATMIAVVPSMAAFKIGLPGLRCSALARNYMTLW